MVVVRTLGPEGTSSDIVAQKYLSWGACVASCPKVRLHSTFEDARFCLINKELLLVPSAYMLAMNFFFDDELLLVSSFIDQSIVYYLASSNNPSKRTLYIHNATSPLVKRFANTIEFLPRVEEVTSTAIAAKLAKKNNSYCIANKVAIETNCLRILNEGFKLRMTWNLFALR